MIEKIGHIKNPLTVIAMFAAIAEISGTGVLPFIEPKNQSVYIWFLMLFPVFLISVFFLTLNFNHKVLYAPSDYKNEDNFLRPFGKATTQEKEDKLREEVEEAEGSMPLENDQQDDEKQAPVESANQPTPLRQSNASMTNSERQANLIANVSLAEKLSLIKLSKDLGLEFRTDVRFETPSNRKIFFDGLALDKDKIHAVEVKLFRSEHVNPSRLDKVLLESEIMANQMKGFDPKEFVIHFMAVIDNPLVDVNIVRDKFSKYLDKYNVNVRLHVVKLEDLKNEYHLCA